MATGSALAFTASTATASDVGLPALAAAWSVSVWFKTVQTGGSCTLVAWGTVAANAWVVLQVDTGQLSFYNGAVGLNGTATGLNDGDWHLAIFTYDATTAKIFVDAGGSADGSSVVAQATVLSDTFFLATDVNGDEYVGALDQVLIYDHALSAPDRASIWAAGLGTATPPTTGLIRHYALDEDTGTTAADPISTHNVTFTTGVSWTTGIVPAPTPTPTPTTGAAALLM